MIGFCTAVFVEVLGTVVTVNDDLVKRILPFVVSGLQPGIKGVLDHKVRFQGNCFCALKLIIVGLRHHIEVVVITFLLVGNVIALKW